MTVLGIYIGKQHPELGFIIEDTIEFNKAIDVPSIVIHEIIANKENIRFIEQRSEGMKRDSKV